MKTIITCALALAGAGTFTTGLQAASAANIAPAAVAPATDKKDDRAVIQLALLLDTSGSMDGLINQARTYLWKIVNEMTLARQNGRLPRIQIALYEYGNDRLDSREAWIRQVTSFTDDLDKVSDELFKLNTNGGTECCGAVIDRAVKDLKWNTEDPNALKMIFIAGNEPFDQGNVAYASAIANGLKQGITVNTIHCGRDHSSNESQLWKDGAKKGDGSFINIDQAATPPEPETPFDKELSTLNTSLNGTYLAYGSALSQSFNLRRQEEQDKNAKKLAPAAAAGRTMTKSNVDAYSNISWDMVDRLDEEGADAGKIISDLKAAGELPKVLQGKSDKEIKEAVKAKKAERQKLQKQIAETGKKRAAWLDEWNRKNEAATGKKNTLEDAVIQAARQQAGKRKFSFVE